MSYKQTDEFMKEMRARELAERARAQSLAVNHKKKKRAEKIARRKARREGGEK